MGGEDLRYALNRSKENWDSNNVLPLEPVRDLRMDEVCNAAQPREAADPNIQAQLDLLTQLVRDLTTSKLTDIEIERQRGYPFLERINQLHIPVKFKMPTWNMYTGREDPVSHIHNFELQTDIQGVRDDSRCRIFPPTLSKTAQQWFFKLQPGSIMPWDGFFRILYSQFSSAMPLPAEPNDLVAIKQGNNEPLKEYIQHFMRKQVLGTPPNPVEGSKNGGKNDKRDNRARGNSHQNDNKKPKTTEQPKLQEYVPKFTTYTILMESRADVFNVTEAVVPYKRPPPLRKDASRRDINKFFRFHNDYSHEINECNHLKEEIQFLIR
ncbi:uncharacterized protein LOC133824174 [Humulus lupulus]|uniref:uncharacterized protein LOC133824174 n=1 Tax=Humulus lupulus TaxID=3486 RepID=UPI002B40075F|nr:uncharacterized protein LOC133824174 [Humulus lupulus]